MSTEPAARLGAVEEVRRIVDEWTETLAQVLESMTDQKPEVKWDAASGTLEGLRRGAAEPVPDPELLWWEQAFQIAPGSPVWIAAPRELWQYVGTLTLKAAGLETVEAGEARNTWLEIVGQSVGGMARSLSALLAREVTCEPGAEHAPDGDPGEWAAVQIRFPESALPTLWFGLSAPLTELIAAPPGQPAAAPEIQPAAATDVPQVLPAHSRTMDLLLEVDLPISISFGRTHLPLKDVLKLTTGSIVELNRGVNETVDVLVNECLIARGEVVVVEGNYGVRIREIASRQQRLRSIP